MVGGEWNRNSEKSLNSELKSSTNKAKHRDIMSELSFKDMSIETGRVKHDLNRK